MSLSLAPFSFNLSFCMSIWADPELVFFVKSPLDPPLVYLSRIFFLPSLLILSFIYLYREYPYLDITNSVDRFCFFMKRGL